MFLRKGNPGFTCWTGCWSAALLLRVVLLHGGEQDFSSGMLKVLVAVPAGFLLFHFVKASSVEGLWPVVVLHITPESF